MKTLIKTLSVLAVMLLFSKAQASDLKSHVEVLNAELQLEEAVVTLKDMFQTKEDHRQIDRVYNQVKAPAAKSVWRFEVDQNKVAFRLNGKLQFWLSDINQENKTFNLNGKTVYLKTGKSFLSAYNEIIGVLKQKTVSRTLFIEEAHAAWFLPLMGMFAFVGAASAAEASMPPQLRCIRSAKATNHIGSPFFPRAADRRNGFRGAMCPKMPRNVDARMRLVANNFKRNGLFMTDNVGARCSNADNISQAEGLICRCVIRKMNANCDHGWNMNESMAMATCRLGFEMYAACMSGPVLIAPPIAPPPAVFDPVTPCSVDKNGAVSGHCGDPITPPIIDKPSQGSGSRD